MYNDNLETPFDTPLAAGATSEFDLKKRNFVSFVIPKSTEFLGDLHSSAKNYARV